MMIRSATSLRNGYDEMVRLAKEKQEPTAMHFAYSLAIARM